MRVGVRAEKSFILYLRPNDDNVKTISMSMSI